MASESDSKQLDDLEIDRLTRALDQELELLLAEAAGPAAPPDDEPVDLTDRVEEPPLQPAARPAKDEEDDWNQARPAEEVWVEPAREKAPPAPENAAGPAASASAPLEAPEKARRLSLLTGEELARLIEAAVEKGVTAALAKRRL
jgi:hypothetical protein